MIVFIYDCTIGHLVLEIEVRIIETIGNFQTKEALELVVCMYVYWVLKYFNSNLNLEKMKPKSFDWIILSSATTKIWL